MAGKNARVLSWASYERTDMHSRSSSYSSASHISNDDLDGLLCHLPSVRAVPRTCTEFGSPGGSSVSPAGSRERGVNNVTSVSLCLSSRSPSVPTSSQLATEATTSSLSSPPSYTLPDAVGNTTSTIAKTASEPGSSMQLHESIVEPWPCQEDGGTGATQEDRTDTSQLYESIVEPVLEPEEEEFRIQAEATNTNIVSGCDAANPLHVSVVEEWPGNFEVDDKNHQTVRVGASLKDDADGPERHAPPMRRRFMELRARRQQDSVCSVKLSDDGDVVVVDDVNVALDVSNENDIVELGELDEVEFGEGETLSPDVEEAVVTAGREMFARSRNNAMIWGSTRSAGARSSVHEDDVVDDDPKQSSATESGMWDNAVSLRGTCVSMDHTQITASLGGAHRALTLLLSRAGPRRQSFEVTMRSLSGYLSSLHDSLPVRQTIEALKNAIHVTQMQEKNHQQQLEQLQERQEKLERLRAKQARGVVTNTDEKTIKQLSLAQVPARAMLPPVSDSVASWRIVDEKSALFSSSYSFGYTIAVVGALFAEFGDLAVRKLPRVGVSAAPAAMDCILSVIDRITKLSATVHVAKRLDGSGVDVRVSCQDSLFSRKRKRAVFSSTVSLAESSWRSIGASASGKPVAMVALASISLTPRFAMRKTRQLCAIPDRPRRRSVV